MAYVRKTRDVWELHVDYCCGCGYEYELSEYSYSEAKQRLKEYRENSPQFPAKLVKKRERINADNLSLISADYTHTESE